MSTSAPDAATAAPPHGVSDDGKLRAHIAPSMLSSDFAALGAEAKRMLDCGADVLHLDLMDGHFVDNLTIGPPIVAALRKHVPTAFLDCHCMVSAPGKWIDALARAGASSMTLHAEAELGVGDDATLTALCERVRAAGMRCGVALKPRTPIDDALRGAIAARAVDFVLVMTVEPGWGGQSFMSEPLDKVRALRAAYPALDIQVDGGVNASTIGECASAGANFIVSGSGVFKAAGGPRNAIATLRTAVGDAIAAAAAAAASS